MSIHLPEAIAAYFAAGSADTEVVALWFTELAVVKDEGQTYCGLSAICRWKADSSRKYTYASKPLACEGKGGKTVVTSRVTSGFPGSPVDLRYSFSLEGYKIASLEISL